MAEQPCLLEFEILVFHHFFAILRLNCDLSHAVITAVENRITWRKSSTNPKSQVTSFLTCPGRDSNLGRDERQQSAIPSNIRRSAWGRPTLPSHLLSAHN